MCVGSERHDLQALPCVPKPGPGGVIKKPPVPATVQLARISVGHLPQKFDFGRIFYTDMEIFQSMKNMKIQQL